MAHGFTDSKGKFHPTSHGKGLSSDQVHLRSPNKSTIAEIRKNSCDEDGNFTKNQEKIKLEKISIFNDKNGTFILQGTNEKTNKPVTKIIKTN